MLVVASSCVLFGAGAPILGQLERSGVGDAIEAPPVQDHEWLKQDAARRNKVLLGKLKEDVHADRLLELSRADAELGRMSQPVTVESCDLSSMLLHPRFGVAQERPGGEVKVRAVDHFSWSAGHEGKAESVNGHVAPGEKMTHDTLDTLAQVMSEFFDRVGEVPGLLKADIDAAFRRIPIMPGQSWACGVAFLVAGLVQSFRFLLALRWCVFPFRYG